MQGTGAAILKLEGPEDFQDNPNHHRRDSAWQPGLFKTDRSSVSGRQSAAVRLSCLTRTYRHSHGLLPPVCRPGIPYFQRLPDAAPESHTFGPRPGTAASQPESATVPSRTSHLTRTRTPLDSHCNIAAPPWPLSAASGPPARLPVPAGRSNRSEPPGVAGPGRIDVEEKERIPGHYFNTVAGPRSKGSNF